MRDEKHHDTCECKICAAQLRAHSIRIAKAIQAMTHGSDNATDELARRLMQFAQSIKTQAVEP